MPTHPRTGITLNYGCSTSAGLTHPGRVPAHTNVPAAHRVASGRAPGWGDAADLTTTEAARVVLALQRSRAAAPAAPGHHGGAPILGAGPRRKTCGHGEGMPWQLFAGDAPAPVTPGPWRYFTAGEGTAVETLVDRVIVNQRSARSFEPLSRFDGYFGITVEIRANVASRPRGRNGNAHEVVLNHVHEDALRCTGAEAPRQS